MRTKRWDCKRRGNRSFFLTRGNLSPRTLGFTLIETIIAMSLVGLLMAVIWSMFRVYTQLEQKGVTAAQEYALIRALHGQMREDLSRLVPIDPDRWPVLTEMQSLSEDSGQLFAENGFLIGGEGELHFLIVDRTRESEQAILRVVSYQSNTSALRDSRLDGSPESSRPLFDGQSRADTGLSDTGLFQNSEFQLEQGEAEFRLPGLERREQDFHPFSQQQVVDDQSGDIATAGRDIELDADDFLVIGSGAALQNDPDREIEILAEIVDTIPEIVRYRFRYFDGIEWQSVWDSDLTGRLPVAIEFQMDFESGVGVGFEGEVGRVGVQVGSRRDGSSWREDDQEMESRRDLISGTISDQFGQPSDRLSGDVSMGREVAAPESSGLLTEWGEGQLEDRLPHHWIMAVDPTPSSDPLLRASDSSLSDDATLGGFGRASSFEMETPLP